MTVLNEQEPRQRRAEDVAHLAKRAFRHLKKTLRPNPERERKFCSSVRSLWGVLFPQEKILQPLRDYYELLEAIILLERRGLVMRDISYPQDANSQNDFLVCLTSIGIKSTIDDEIILLVDRPEEIAIALEQKVGPLDPVVRQYYLESLRAYQEELYISSVICLGAASERAIHWLAESIDSYSARYQKPTKEGRYWNIDRLIKDLIDTVIPNIFKGDKKFKQKLEKRLKGLGDIYRENRNDAGHPDPIEQTSWLGEDQEVLLLQFRRYITTICEAIERLKKQSVS